VDYFVALDSTSIVGNLMLGPTTPVPLCCGALSKIFATTGSIPLSTGDAATSHSQLRAFVVACADPDGSPPVDCQWTLLPDAAGTISATDAAYDFYATYSCGVAPSTDTVNIDCTGASAQDGATCPPDVAHRSLVLTCVTPRCDGDGGGCDQ
jgi:hypothetical protein